jgi:hypothetical protein
MSTFTKYLIVILIGLILLLTFTYSTDYIKINLPLTLGRYWSKAPIDIPFSFSSNPFSFSSKKQNNNSESQVISEKPINSSVVKEVMHHQPKSIPKETISQDNNKFIGLNMPKSVPFSLDYLSNKEEEQEKNFTFENFLNNSDVEQQDKENINNFLIDNNFTTNESDNIDNKLFIQTDESQEQVDYQMTENTHNAITNALRNI